MTDNDLARFFDTMRKESQRSKYTLSPSQKKKPDPRRILANEIEHEAAQRLRALGFQVARQSHKAHFDLLADGLRCEVKAARWDGKRYQFTMRDNKADVALLCCVDCDKWFIVPFCEVSGRVTVKVTRHDPRDYAGRLMGFYEAWDILPDLARAAGNSYQKELWA